MVPIRNKYKDFFAYTVTSIVSISQLVGMHACMHKSEMSSDGKTSCFILLLSLEVLLLLLSLKPCLCGFSVQTSEISPHANDYLLSMFFSSCNEYNLPSSLRLKHFCGFLKNYIKCWAIYEFQNVLGTLYTK